MLNRVSRSAWWVVPLSFLFALVCGRAEVMARPSACAAWRNGPPKDPNYFPIAVWLQAPKNAPKFKGYGVHLYRIR